MRSVVRWLLPLTVIAVAAPAGCGGAAPTALSAHTLVAPAASASSAAPVAAASPPSAASPASAASAGSPSSPAPQAPASAAAADAHVLPRSAVRQVVAQGLGAFLQHIDLDDQPVRMGGKFRGFRVALLRGDRFWNGVDLKAGDVVTAVNGFPIEHPEQALTAFESLDVASELRVAYDRDGQPRELAYAIADDK